MTRTARPRRRTVALAATGVGLLTGFFGVGGGSVVVPVLALALGFTMPAGVGTSLLVIAINSTTALASRVGTGVDLDRPVILTFSLFGAIGSVLGGKLVHPHRPTHAESGVHHSPGRRRGIRRRPERAASLLSHGTVLPREGVAAINRNAQDGGPLPFVKPV